MLQEERKVDLVGGFFWIGSDPKEEGERGLAGARKMMEVVGSGKVEAWVDGLDLGASQGR